MFTFVPNKQFSQLITILPHLLAILETANAELQSIVLWFTDQNNIPRKYYTNYWVDIKKRNLHAT